MAHWSLPSRSCDIDPDNEVIITVAIFVASASAIALAGSVMSPERVESAITDRTRVIKTVRYEGYVDRDRIWEITRVR